MVVLSIHLSLLPFETDRAPDETKRQKKIVMVGNRFPIRLVNFQMW